MISNLRSWVFLVSTLFLLIGCKEEGVLAKPSINPNPKQAILLLPSIARTPDGIDLDSIEHYMIARYESRKLECSQIRYLAGGSVITPMYEVPLGGNPIDGFIVWNDLIMPDHCDWKLSLINYGLLKDDNRIVRAGFTNVDIRSPQLTFYCIWGGDLNGSCRRFHQKSAPFDDTTLIINVKEN